MFTFPRGLYTYGFDSWICTEHEIYVELCSTLRVIFLDKDKTLSLLFNSISSWHALEVPQQQVQRDKLE